MFTSKPSLQANRKSSMVSRHFPSLPRAAIATLQMTPLGSMPACSTPWNASNASAQRPCFCSVCIARPDVITSISWPPAAAFRMRCKAFAQLSIAFFDRCAVRAALCSTIVDCMLLSLMSRSKRSACTHKLDLTKAPMAARSVIESGWTIFRRLLPRAAKAPVERSPRPRAPIAVAREGNIAVIRAGARGCREATRTSHS
mmetsp:Transcript_3282/g.8496  ORF Transcript_3282/g.8496 Transcript_3282/m.8496 type:complete len:200 (+) Transcript_3282:232-831(+)